MANIKKITKIELQEGNKKRFNIYIDDIYSFSVHEDILIAHKLFKEKEVDEEELRKILLEEERNKCWQKSLKYLNYKQRTVKEIKRYLLNENFSNEDVDYTLKKLIEKEFVNDELYAERFIKQRIDFNPKGKKLLKFELQQKGVSEAIINQSLENIDFELEYSLACNLLEKKQLLTKGNDKDKQRRIANFLERRGFSYDVIIRILNENNMRYD